MNSINIDFLVNKYHLNKFTLAFSKEIESEYQSWKFSSYIKLVRIILMILLGLYIIGSMIDALLDPSTKEIHFYILSVIVPLFFIIILFTFNKHYEKYHQFILSITFLFSGLGLMTMMIYKPYNFIYPFGLMMVFSAAFFLLNIKFIFSAINLIVSLIILDILIVFFSDISSYNVIAYNFFYSGVILINIIASYSIELYQRKNYLFNKELSLEKNSLHYDNLKRIEDLAETENKLSILIENAFDGIYILDNKKYEYVNQSFSKITGYSIEELTASDFDFNILLTEKGSQFIKERYRLREEGKEVPTKYDIEIKSKDGEIKHLEVTTESIGKEGQVKVFGIMRDVTEKYMASKIQKEQNEFRKLLVDISTRFINLSLNESHSEINKALEIMAKYVKADRAYIFDLDYNTGICDNTYEYCNDGTEQFIDELQNIQLGEEWLVNFGKKEIIYIPDVAVLPEGYSKEVLEPQGIKSLIAVPLIDDEVPIGFVGFDFVQNYHNYSETDMQMLTIFSHLLVNIKLKLENENKLVKAKEKAEQSDRLKTSFLGNLSHEIRTPMNGIIGFMNLLKLPDLTDEERDEYLKLISTSGSRLLTTLDDIIEISQIDAGLAPLNIVTVDLYGELMKYGKICEQNAKNKGIEYKVNINLPETKRKINTDVKKVQRIVHHLLCNAIKFTERGEVSFNVYSENEKIIISIKDTGIGIPEDMQQKIFERFVQAEYFLSRNFEGSGLGLAIVKEYANMLNFQIKLESEKGKGSTFYIII